MESQTYYIDFAHGNDSDDGLSPERAFRSHAGRRFAPGDSVLFRRGGVFRGALHTSSGREGHPVIYGAYGDGPRPLFLGSVAGSDAGTSVLRSRISRRTASGFRRSSGLPRAANRARRMRPPAPAGAPRKACSICIPQRIPVARIPILSARSGVSVGWSTPITTS